MLCKAGAIAANNKNIFKKEKKTTKIRTRVLEGQREQTLTQERAVTPQCHNGDLRHQ